MQQLLTSFETSLQRFVAARPTHTWVMGLARSVLAMGTLLTLLTNQVSTLLYQTQDNKFINPVLQTPSVQRDFNFFLLLGEQGVWLMQVLAVITLITVISGFWPRITAIVHWWICCSFLFASSAVDGGDQIAAILTLLFIPVCLFDSRKNHWFSTGGQGSSPFDVVPLAFFFLIRLQVAVIYFHSAVGKFNVPEWANGTALYYWLEHSIFGMPGWLRTITLPMLENSVLVTLLTYGVMMFELLLFLAFTMTSKRRLYLLIPAVLFHFFIVLYHGIFSFFFSISAGLILYLLPLSFPIPVWIASVFKRQRSRLVVAK